MIKLLDYSNLVERIARQRFSFFRMYSSAITLEDAIQSGHVGLCIAKERYDTKSEKTFGSFARWYVQGEIMRYIFNNLSIVKIENIKGKMGKVKKYINENGEDDLDIMANYLKIDEVLLSSIIDMIHGRNINQSILQSKKDIDRCGEVDSHRSKTFKEVEKLLNLYENLAITYKFLHGYSDKRACEIMNITEGNLKKIMNSAKSKLSKSPKLKNIYYEL